MKKSLLLIACIVCALFFVVNTVDAINLPIVEDGGLSAPQPYADGAENPDGSKKTGSCYKEGNCRVDQIITLVNNIVRALAAISGALALLMYIIGGVWMLFSAGNSSRIERGKDILTGTTIAIFFILGGWLLIDFTLQALGSRYRLQEPDDDQQEFCCVVSDAGLPGNTFCWQNLDQAQCDEKAAIFTGASGAISAGNCITDVAVCNGEVESF